MDGIFERIIFNRALHEKPDHDRDYIFWFKH